MLIKLNWITLRVSNLEASLGFYHDMLGLPIQRRFESRGRQIAMLGIENEAKLELQIYKNIALVNGKKTTLEGVIVYNGVEAFVPQTAVDLIQ